MDTFLPGRKSMPPTKDKKCTDSRAVARGEGETVEISPPFGRH